MAALFSHVLIVLRGRDGALTFQAAVLLLWMARAMAAVAV